MRKSFVAILLVIGVLFWRPIMANWNQPQWEDGMLFPYAKATPTFWSCFTTRGYYPGIYRPVTTNLFYHWASMLPDDYQLRACHVLLIALYAVNGLLAYWICRWFWPHGAALAVALIWVSRLAHTETLLYTDQNETLLHITFSLLATRAYLGRRYWLATGAVFLGLLCKESVVVMPFILLLIAYARGYVRPVAMLPFLALVPWYLMAHSFLKTGLYWQYDWSPANVIGNYVAYLGAFSNLAIHPVDLSGPITVALSAYPAIMQAQNSSALQVAFCVLVALSAWTVWKRGPMLLPAMGFLIFVLALAPTIAFKDRALMYYGSDANLGLSLTVVGVWVVLCGD